jgi:hypothetical protein
MMTLTYATISTTEEILPHEPSLEADKKASSLNYVLITPAQKVFRRDPSSWGDKLRMLIRK